MKNKFKVGDKVRVIKSVIDAEEYNKYIGTITTIISDGIGGNTKYALANNRYGWCDEELELVVFTKDDLQEGDILTLRNGSKCLYSEHMNIDCLWKSNINEDLTNNGSCGEELDIVKVERPTNCNTIYERQEEVKEMTLKEVCNALGYEVKIVEEEIL